MQPYFAPYLGYFQLIHAVDSFVIYDDIEYTKKGWINRNRININGEPVYVTLPLRAGPDDALVVERALADSFATKDCAKLLNRIRETYRKASHFAETMPLVEEVFAFPDPNLFEFIFHSVRVFCRELGIETPMDRSSTLAGNAGTGQDRVLNLCAGLGADGYTNPVSGRHLYDASAFAARGIRLQFLCPSLPTYRQPGDRAFVPGLSIIDVLMCNERDAVREYLEVFDIVPADSVVA